MTLYPTAKPLLLCAPLNESCEDFGRERDRFTVLENVFNSALECFGWRLS